MKPFLTTDIILMCAGLMAAPCSAHADNAGERIVGIGDKVYTLPDDEADALEFLYRSMPMSDYLMYPPEYHLRNIRASLKAREELPWAKDVPEDIWRHFVLPARANNEYLDNFRSTYYEELRDRVKDLDMYDAALEVNHWLHEKVTYEPSDARTSAPMATIRTSKGRCGEESVLGVAAFRTVGIPARQVYTPRWAHTDDNHAWVEVWVDGKWHFLGACEPEPELDRAWFNAPASRGMLMHTRVFGDYNGPEQQISKSKGITEINVTDNYVPVRESGVTVTDAEGRRLKGVKVEYKIYNYAEFFTAATRVTDSNGNATLKTGQGDMLAWATDGKYFGFAKIDSPHTTLVLDHPVGQTFETDIDIVPPVENPIPSKVTKEDIEECARRFELENTLRDSYAKTFYGEPYCTLSAAEVKERFGNKANLVETQLRRAKGNWQAIWDFLRQSPAERLDEAIAMLGAVTDKDMRDTPARIFYATLTHTVPDMDNPLYVDYILSPRISAELLSDWRMTMRSPAEKDKPMSPQQLIKAASAIEIDDAANAYRVPVTPYEVWKSGHADSRSRDIYFVARCRNNGIPARIDPVTGLCQYHDGKDWVSVDFGGVTKSAVIPEGRFSATFTPEGYLTNPEYYRHFTISNMDGGSPRLYEFGEDMGENYESLLRDGVSLPAGYYLLTTGVRQASGAVSAHMSFFNVQEGQTTTSPLTMRHSPEAIEVIGSIDAEQRYTPHGAESEQSILSTTGRGYFIIGVLGDTDEPSNHAAGELAAVKDLLVKWNRPVLLLGSPRSNLADNPMIHWGTDPDGKVRQMLEAISPAQDDNMRLPLIVVADSFGRVVFMSKGYDTSLAQKLATLIPQL